jgi:predicted phage tail protein
MTSVILHGALARKFGKEHRFMINKPIDAIRALVANKKGFKHAFRTWGRKGRLYEIICDGVKIETEKQLQETQNIKEIHIAPIIMGSSNAAKIIVGVILIVVSIYFPQMGAFMQAALQGAGMSLIMGGIMGMLFPPPVPDAFSSEASYKSFLFASLENSANQGISVPLGYGRLRIGTKVISTSIQPHRMSGGGSYYGNINVGAGEPSPGQMFENWQTMRHAEQMNDLHQKITWMNWNNWNRQYPVEEGIG